MLFSVSQVVEGGEKQQNSKVKHVTYVAFYWVSSLWLPLKLMLFQGWLFIKSLRVIPQKTLWMIIFSKVLFVILHKVDQMFTFKAFLYRQTYTLAQVPSILGWFLSYSFLLTSLRLNLYRVLFGTE